MTAIWGSGPEGQWHTLVPAAYQAEAQLHDLVENAPQMLPLAGSPRLTVLGREVRLGTGSADLLAVESTGRLVIIEVKRQGTPSRGVRWSLRYCLMRGTCRVFTLSS